MPAAASNWLSAPSPDGRDLEGQQMQPGTTRAHAVTGLDLELPLGSLQPSMSAQMLSAQDSA
jgi:hypothetical protein